MTESPAASLFRLSPVVRSCLTLNFCLLPASSEDGVDHDDDLQMYAHEASLQSLRQEFHVPEDSVLAIALNLPSKRDLLFALNPLSNSRPIAVDSQKLDVFVSTSFILHYDIDMDARHTAAVVQKLIPLRRVLLACTSALDQVRESTADFAGKICRSGDRFPGNQELLVLETQPVRQGILNRQTKVTVVQVDPETWKAAADSWILEDRQHS